MLKDACLSAIDIGVSTSVMLRLREYGDKYIESKDSEFNTGDRFESDCNEGACIGLGCNSICVKKASVSLVGVIDGEKISNESIK